MSTQHSHQPAEDSQASKLDDQYFWDFVTFSAGDRIFRVPKYKFLEDSDCFHTMYDLDALGQECGRDHPHLHAVELPGVDPEEFQTFLRVLYPRRLIDEQQLGLTQKEWLCVLRLSHQWGFQSLRERALAQINFEDLPVILRILVSQACKIPSSLIAGANAISVEEAEHLGLSTAIRICEVREKRYRRSWDAGHVRGAVERVFGKEIRECSVPLGTVESEAAEGGGVVKEEGEQSSTVSSIVTPDNKGKGKEEIVPVDEESEEKAEVNDPGPGISVDVKEETCDGDPSSSEASETQANENEATKTLTDEKKRKHQLCPEDEHEARADRYGTRFGA
ncbi:hypothetical protein DFP72DRAFT_919985 [Ephemerocybe angulata]|uniref:BTB domain-containing protein n=1 Tax=Ephemerocybe angulata TaxID=980116 RepID=A0A8H6HHW2_9AGAR|nr:hypothetical protein DFP72DRAFT_919985 [Tulosesus angulatus]